MNPIIQLLPHRSAVANDRSTTMQLLVRVGSGSQTCIVRPRLSLTLAIDRSGSMRGEPLEQAKLAACHLLDLLQNDDLVSVVDFDTEVSVVAPLQLAKNRAEIKTRISAIQSGGSTDLHLGWLQACSEHALTPAKNCVRRTIVLSDGATNSGITNTEEIVRQVEEWQQRGVGTTTVGLGLHYNEDLLSKMAIAGGGNFFHVAQPSDVAKYFETEMQSLCFTFATLVSLNLECFRGVQALRVYNPLRSNSRGDLVLTDMVVGYPKEIVFELSVPPWKDAEELCRVTVNYTNRVNGERKQLVSSLALPAVPGGQLPEFPVTQEVLQKRSLQLVARAFKSAHTHIAGQEYDKAKDVLKQAVMTLDEVESTSELEAQKSELRDLLQSLERQEYQSVSKQATARSTSLSYSSITLCETPLLKVLKKFSALPREQQTPERFQEMMRE